MNFPCMENVTPLSRLRKLGVVLNEQQLAKNGRWCKNILQ